MATTPETATRRAGADHRLGFTTQRAEVGPTRLDVRGELPPWLSGALVRTGPAAFEAGRDELRHWFDGLAMLHRFGFEDGDVVYSNRFLRSRAWRAAEERGRLSYREFATDPCRSLFRRVTSLFAPDVTDNGNVNVARLGDELLAMTETALPVAFDPRTLETAGVRAKAPGPIATAHPHFDRERGAMVNHAIAMGPRSEYRLYAQHAADEREAIARHGVREPAYMHSFAITGDHLVLTACPLVVNPLRLVLSGRPFIENYRWEPERGATFLVFDRRSGRRIGAYRTGAFFLFHHVNAFDAGDGTLVLDVCAYEDASIVEALYLDRLRRPGAELPRPQLRRYRIDLDGGGADWRPIAPAPLELPRIDYRERNGRPYRHVYGVGTENVFDRILKVDVETGATIEWAEPGCHPGEPVFVPAPGERREDDGVLLSVVLAPSRGTSQLLVLDARDLRELARAEAPHHIPFGFHGQHFGA